MALRLELSAIIGSAIIMESRYPRLLATTLWFVAIVQFALGAAFLAMPEQAAHALNLGIAPGWANWLFGMMAARFLGFAFGMAVAARNPAGARSWIVAMIGIQVIDWIVTLKYLALGAVTLVQVNTASFLPVLFVIGLAVAMPRPVAATEVRG